MMNLLKFQMEVPVLRGQPERGNKKLIQSTKGLALHRNSLR